MNKAELISAMAAGADMTKADATKALNAFLDVVMDALKKGEKVTLVGFGTLSVAERAARTGINPATKETIEIPARKVVKFKPSTELWFE
ncbi:MAG TPA: HU family DNA-binding protein [Mediterranea massiliensis]|uniref:HU family DNA-binding protein n=1 Tax=Mediterranea massiliensis TaxID=1841865 RepID=A0A921HW77_9BACT|nr:HU family DNA-binding protein [Mediterranea massiliensis]CCZ48975.1 dNA-binding protein HU-beta [Bacteroides sp. CAG:661]HJF91618.1 HU family DNA-binding protein [Mediterranea massiliensis]